MFTSTKVRPCPRPYATKKKANTTIRVVYVFKENEVTSTRVLFLITMSTELNISPNSVYFASPAATGVPFSPNKSALMFPYILPAPTAHECRRVNVSRSLRAAPTKACLVCKTRVNGFEELARISWQWVRRRIFLHLVLWSGTPPRSHTRGYGVYARWLITSGRISPRVAAGTHWRKGQLSL